MNIFIHIVVLFIFILTILFINIPKLTDDQTIKIKFYLFVSVFIFEFVINVLIDIYNGSVVNIGKIWQSALTTALVGVVGYAVYQDMLDSPDTVMTKYKGATLATVFISVALMFSELSTAIVNKVSI